MSTLILSGPGFFLEVPKKYSLLHCSIRTLDFLEGDNELTPVPEWDIPKPRRRRGRAKAHKSSSPTRARIEILLRYEDNKNIYTDSFYSDYDNISETKKLYDILIKQIAEQHDVMHLVKLYHQSSQQLALGLVGDTFERVIAEQVYEMVK